MVERKIPILDDHGSGVPSRLCATVCKIYSTEFDHVFPNSDIYSSVAGWCLVVVMSNSASRMAIFLTKWQAKEQLAGGCALSRFGGFSNQRCGCNFWPNKGVFGETVFFYNCWRQSRIFLIQSGEEKSPIHQSDELISWYLENITYGTICSRQLWLVVGVKLMEIHVTTCFPGRNNYVMFGRFLRDFKKTHYTFEVVVSNIFNFHPYLGKIPILTHIFQMGWNHHSDFCFPEVPEQKNPKDFKNHPVGWIRPLLNQRNGGVIPGRPTTILYRLASAPPLV